MPYKSDHDKAFTRLRLNFYHLYRVLRDLRESHSPEALLADWKRAERPSQEWRNGLFYEQAVTVLYASMDQPREQPEELVRQYVLGRRPPVPAETHEAAV